MLVCTRCLQPWAFIETAGRGMNFDSGVVALASRTIGRCALCNSLSVCERLTTSGIDIEELAEFLAGERALFTKLSTDDFATRPSLWRRLVNWLRRKQANES